jgi:catechol 2,3-dioxygenase-like lactoylglutathione lyase family enzyme
MPETLTEHVLVDENGRRVITPELHHFGAATTRNQEMQDWYRKVLGFDLVLRTGESYVDEAVMNFVTNDGAHHRGVFISTPFLTDDDHKLDQSRIHHLAWSYASIGDLLESWDRIAALGIEPTICVCHGVSFAFYYKDPDNTTVELQTDAFTEPGSALEFMKSDRMKANPMGGYVDPANLVKAVKAGVSLDDLREHALAGDYEPADPAKRDPGPTW